jgi:chemosensory pili system protein ChpA (sensor histidine kinase/response regulator)
MRTLHTFKGGARLAGAMRLGEMAHRLETAIEHLAGTAGRDASQVEPLLARADAMVAALRTAAQAGACGCGCRRARPGGRAVHRCGACAVEPAGPAGQPRRRGQHHPGPHRRRRAPAAGCGERPDRQPRPLRSQLRDIELQAESQITSRMEAAKAASQSFDPLEMDRFTRFQELTRMMAESVNDVATVQRSLQRTLQSTEDELAAQARQTRELQEDLLRTRMVEFESLADRLYRVVRQAAKETGKQVRLDIVGWLDRSRPRCAGAHDGPSSTCCATAWRTASRRRPCAGRGQGCHRRDQHHRAPGRQRSRRRVPRRRRRPGPGAHPPACLERGCWHAEPGASDAEVANLIFMPGFSTATEVTELAGRGVGMDVVRTEVNAMGGRIETASTPGAGHQLQAGAAADHRRHAGGDAARGDSAVAVPSTLIEVVRRVPTEQVEQAYAAAATTWATSSAALLLAGCLLQHRARSATCRPHHSRWWWCAARRSAWRARRRSAGQPGSGGQARRAAAVAPAGPGRHDPAASGAVALIYNPVALAGVRRSSAAP